MCDCRKLNKKEGEIKPESKKWQRKEKAGKWREEKWDLGGLQDICKSSLRALVTQNRDTIKDSTSTDVAGKTGNGRKIMMDQL